jgi:hypothetical protein
MQKSGWILGLLGLIGIAYFWVSDPVIGMAQRWISPDRLVDAANELRIGTWVGIAGSVIIMAIGLWLGSRRVV